jgi:dihydroorotate dehydrogenase (NAD+) catalytic subunit
MNTEDSLEFIMAGASAIQIGTASFIDPMASVKILEGIEAYLQEKGFSDLSSLTGCINKK